MTAAAWARRYQTDLLQQLETEANEGWPDLPWPPKTCYETVTAHQIHTLNRLLTHLNDLMRADEQRHNNLIAANARHTWQHTGELKAS